MHLMNGSQEKMILLHCYSKYGLYVIWYGVSRHNFCRAFQVYIRPFIASF